MNGKSKKQSKKTWIEEDMKQNEINDKGELKTKREQNEIL